MLFVIMTAIVYDDSSKTWSQMLFIYTYLSLS